MRHRLAALGGAAACVLAVTLAAQQGRFRGGVELVSLSVTVMEGAKYITGLEQGDFEVFEDGTKQNITFFSAAQQPIALAILSPLSIAFS